jgi:hypothetical protein
MADLKLLRSRIARMGSDLFDVIDIPFEQTTELQRQLLAAFCYGMVFAVGRIERLSPPDVHALAISCLVDVFKYSAAQAGSFSQHLINASLDKAVHPTINTVVHRGIDGHKQWEGGQREVLRENIYGVFEAVGS